MPTYTSQKFQNKTRFYLHFLTCAWAALQQEKNCVPQFKKFANAHLHISFWKTKKIRLLPHRNSLSCLSAAFLKLLKFLISNFLNLTPAASVWISENYFLVFQVFFFLLVLGGLSPNPLGDVEFDQWLDFAKPSTTSTFRNRLSTLS